MSSYATDSAYVQDRSSLIVATSVLTETLLRVQFSDSSFTYHAQWLHDARNDRNPSRSAQDTFTVHVPDAGILKAAHEGFSAGTVVVVSWTDGTKTRFPGAWLRVLGPLVAKSDTEIEEIEGVPNKNFLLTRHPGWTTETVEIPSIDYNFIFPQENPTTQQQTAISIKVIDMMFHEGRSGILKVVNLPPADFESERRRQNTLVTKILKQLFGAVFVHPRRAPDETFNISSDYGNDRLRGAELHNYQTDMLLLPHCDHAHYDQPARVQGLYCLEGESHNTFVSSLAVLETMQREAPDLFPYMLKSPMVVGRVAHFYDPPMFQATVDPAVTMTPSFPYHVKRVRWHPHLAGSLLAPFQDFIVARKAYQKFQEIARRPSHQLTLQFRPGDLYIWDNFHTLHGRERVISSPRTTVGQTVSEQVISERYRSMQIMRLKDLIDEAWLVHVPTPQLFEIARLLCRDDVSVDS